MADKTQGREEKTESTPERRPAVAVAAPQYGQAEMVPLVALQRAASAAGRLTPADVLALQRTVGNRAVNRLLATRRGRLCLQAKLTVGPVGDTYEQEADRVAEQVVARGRGSEVANRQFAQRQEEERQGNKETGRRGDKETRRRGDGGTREQGAFLAKFLLQRQEDEEEVQAKFEIANRKSPIQNPLGGFAVTPEIESRLAARQGQGSPLPADVRAQMEPRFGADFGGVRVHADDEAAAMSRKLQAQSFTHEQDIYFGAGYYNPGSGAGKRLLAHELTHTIQQTGGRHGVQRKTANLTLLPPGIIGKPWIGKSTTQKIQDVIGKYNAIADDNVEYAKQMAILDDVIAKAQSWLAANTKKKPRKVEPISKVLGEAMSEKVGVSSHLGGMSQSGTATAAKLGASAALGGVVGALIAAPIPTLAALGAVGLGIGIYKGVEAIKARRKKRLRTATLSFDKNRSAGTVKAIAKAKYDANTSDSLLNDQQYGQIATLSQDPKGLKWLKKAGLKSLDEMREYARGRNFSNWENEPATFKMWVATEQYILGKLSPIYLYTPGYQKAISALGKDEGKKEIFEKDETAWARTLKTPTTLTQETKKALEETNKKAGKPGKQGYLGSEAEMLKTNAAAMKIVQRIFIILQKGLTYRESEKDKTFQEWTEPVAVALSHGGRVNIRIPAVKVGDDPHAFFNWLTGGKGSMEVAKMYEREAGTHRLAIGENKPAKGKPPAKPGSFKEKGGFMAAIQAMLGLEKGETIHFGLDLPVGGLGQEDMNGKVILPNGSYGHLYIGYKPPTTKRDGGLLIGCETDAPGMTNPLGHKHTAKATSAEMGPTGTHKDTRVGAKKGGMMVDLTQMDTHWMEQLKEMEETVNAGRITTEQLVGEKLGRKEVREAREKELAEWEEEMAEWEERAEM